jgi:hypothetical protein
MGSNAFKSKIRIQILNQCESSTFLPMEIDNSLLSATWERLEDLGTVDRNSHN